MRLSNCCDAQAVTDTDLCSDCKEHTGFYEEDCVYYDNGCQLEECPEDCKLINENKPLLF